MKFYIYISDTKIDMLYGQIPKRLRDNVATELKINLQVLSTTFSEAASETTRYSKLDIVTNYIEKHESIGTVDRPERFIKSTMPLSWAVGLGDLTGLGPYLVYFAGETDESILGMGGSRKHVIGEEPGEKDIVGQIPTSSTIGFFLQEFLINEDPKKKPLNKYGPEAGGLGTYYLPTAIAQLSKSVNAPAQPMEFVAKRLFEGEAEGKHVLLASPIYVALAE